MPVTKQFSIPLDVKRSVSNSELIEVVEGDNGNVLEITLTDDGAAVDLTGCLVCVVFEKPNGATVEQDSNGHGVTLSKTANNKFTIELYAASFSPGMMTCEVQVYSGVDHTTMITSAQFTFKCRRGIVSDETIQSIPEWPILIDMMERCRDLEAAAAHAGAHASNGRDPVTPVSIGAAVVINTGAALAENGWVGTPNMPKATAVYNGETGVYTLTVPEGWACSENCELAFDVPAAPTYQSAELYNSGTNTADVYVDSNGAPVVDTAWNATGYIAVDGYTQLVYGGLTDATYYASFYSDNIGTVVDTPFQAGTEEANVIAIPAGAAFVRFSVIDADVNTFTCKGQKASLQIGDDNYAFAAVPEWEEGDAAVIRLLTTAAAEVSQSVYSINAPYTQTVNVAGMTADMQPIADIVLSSSQETAEAELEGWGMISRIDTGADSIKATCFAKKPEAALNLTMKVVK